MMAEQTIPVTLHDLALALYLNPETGNPVSNADGRCETCGESGGAHYCEPHWRAHNRLERLVREAIADGQARDATQRDRHYRGSRESRPCAVPGCPEYVDPREHIYCSVHLPDHPWPPVGYYANAEAGVGSVKERDFALLDASHGRLRSALEDIAQHDGADWDVEGVCGQAVDALAYIPDPPPFDEVEPQIEDAHFERRATLDRGPTLTGEQRVAYTRARSLGESHEQALGRVLKLKVTA